MHAYSGQGDASHVLAARVEEKATVGSVMHSLQLGCNYTCGRYGINTYFEESGHDVAHAILR